MKFFTTVALVGAASAAATNSMSQTQPLKAEDGKTYGSVNWWTSTDGDASTLTYDCIVKREGDTAWSKNDYHDKEFTCYLGVLDTTKGDKGGTVDWCGTRI